MLPPELAVRRRNSRVREVGHHSNSCVHVQKTPLHHAVMNDDVFNLAKLLEDGADPNAQV